MYAVFKAILLLVREHLGQRPLRTGLTILGVAIGVSAWLAIRLANGEVFRSFEASVETVVGEASLQISGAEQRLDERLLLTIRKHPAVLSAHPVLKISSSSINTQGSQYQDFLILGLDALELANSEGVNFSESGQDSTSLEFLLAADSIFVGHGLAAKMGWAAGDIVEVRIGEQEFQVMIRGVVSPASPNRRRLDDIAIMDIAAAQTMFGYVGKLDQINLVLSKDSTVAEVIADLERVLPSTTTVSRTSQRTQQVDAMVKVFQFNLTMLSTVGLLVGLFLVYNAISFSVVQHRREIGILRAIGMSRKQISLVFSVGSECCWIAWWCCGMWPWISYGASAHFTGESKYDRSVRGGHSWCGTVVNRNDAGRYWSWSWRGTTWRASPMLGGE